MRKALVAVAVFSLAVSSCSSEPEAPVVTEGSGPPTVRVDVVQGHEVQLDKELGPRPPGSQQEQIASQYVLGHLQRAGYLVRLDAVPVGNLVESSNLLAVPPSENDPKVIVVTGYATPPKQAEGGEEVGFLLELARAFNVASPDHDAEFGALGADIPPERRGARRLARLLLDEGVQAQIVEIGEIEDGAPVTIKGALAAAISENAATDDFVESLFTDAGFQWAIASGDPADLSRTLLGYLKEEAG